MKSAGRKKTTAKAAANDAGGLSGTDMRYNCIYRKGY